MNKGARTRTAESDPAATAAFTGTWRYDPADPVTRRNIRSTRTMGQGGTSLSDTPEQGAVAITADYDNRLTARTADGCTWTLLARGNTAKLDPPAQTCPRPGDTTITLRSWTIATDGHHQDAIMIGADEHNDAFTVGTGSLTKA
ncbi:hypothetical protein OG874_08775 [Nocardia sp. NBC_00565]|uniref:hypothetical protein n=1 Tax=Nocardia sp. NBC_00565 TaxID=2975993 RepID=UPI002E8086B9|nr:hypothetical protein [Nocardia sp. NBC_00565]WUC05224.1 hypothetical protein OG874_08775 [Nocardia sp. NBC_00565]